MTATSDRLDLPARRRRHARLIAALTRTVGACASAAQALYQPVADAPPGQEAVVVDPLPVIYLSHTAAPLLEAGRAEDDARWPAAVAWEREQAQRTNAARVALARAEEIVEEPGLSWPVPLPTAEQGAVIDLAGAGDQVAELWRADPEQAVALVRELVAGREFMADEVLDAAVDAAIGAGLLALADAGTASDPSMMAEQCLEAVPYLVLAVALASADLD
ncbi:hypothetical protein CLM85_13930 [Streptomyces albidoflavus]|uniref:hypothetical protein n=1 Tax=Streptomyces albidoflavus TaxID=1886 RepID=UPI000BADEE9A|nr:hypothetical protein [Streptomyces albidoflavus]PAX82030.1 hypothetical protein CLM81_30230 [Streptomyces albidoflavus]PBO19225.1 hypothetical protein CLM83_07750 [Streptomyces albidoflavus]PBO23804.1 hypothetical protein CLM85_13930 [Streptomyces albidoflavus]PBO30096.1 hypothetical protein CLM84_10370 [Streptomyces albidoflavus]